MFFRKQFRSIAVFTLSIFICFTLTLDYSYSQEENPLLKAQGLYKQGNFVEAVKVLEAFIVKIKGSPIEKKRLAEANFLLARIYYEAGEDARVLEYMKHAVAANPGIGKEEDNLDFKSRLELVREEWLKSQAAKEETASLLTKETAKTAAVQSTVQEKEKPAAQRKKKKKFPWLLAILGTGVAAVLIVLLGKKKNNSQPLPDATYDNGVLTVKGVRYELAAIPAGEFQMGSNSPEAFPDERPVHPVQISKAFWMGRTEVTQGLWQAVMGGNPSFFKNNDTFPVEQVSWDDCQVFITKLNQMLGVNAFRLPTEAEWEYACRAGTTGERYGILDAVAWYSGNSGNTSHPVGQKQANFWGLFDMLGNLLEWCQDYYGPYAAEYQIDPSGPPSGELRVYRGGSWGRDARFVRSANRSSVVPSYLHGSLGFRLASNK